MRSRGSLRLSGIVLPVLLLVSLAAMASGQEPQKAKSGQDQSLKLKSELIQLRAVVTDKKGNIIDGLKKEDFEVLDNGFPQEISFFSLERVGASASATKPEPGVPAPTVPRTSQPAANPGRTIVLFVDTLHLTPVSLITAKKALKTFIDNQLTDRDVVAIVTTGRSLGVLQQFMSDKRMLKLAVDRISIFATNSSSFTPYIAAEVLDGDETAYRAGLEIVEVEDNYIPVNDQESRRYVAGRASQILAEGENFRRATLATLEAVSKRLSGLPGQKMIGMISDGFTLRERGGGEDTQGLEAIIGNAAKAGVVIYSFYSRGLEPPPEFSAANRVSGQNFSIMINQSRSDDQGLLRTLASETGGEAYINTNDMSGAMGKMLNNNSIYYAIAYYVPDYKSPKKLRKIAVKVKGHPEYTIRAQKGYIPSEQPKEEAAANPQQKLLDEMISPLPVTAIGVTSECDFLEGAADQDQATLRVHIEGGSLHYDIVADKTRLDCEIAIAVFDNSGKMIFSNADGVKADFTEKQLAAAKQLGYRYVHRLALKPGLYQVRVGVREVSSGLIGTSMCWVTIPDLKKGKLAMSSLILGKSAAAPAAAPAAGATPKQAQAADTTPAQVLGTPSFKSGEIISYAFMVYNLDESKQDASLTVEVLNNDKSVYKNTEPLQSKLGGKDSKGVAAGGSMRLALPPGIYTLRISVKDAKSKKPAVETADFEMSEGK